MVQVVPIACALGSVVVFSVESPHDIAVAFAAVCVVASRPLEFEVPWDDAKTLEASLVDFALGCASAAETFGVFQLEIDEMSQNQAGAAACLKR